MIVLQVLAGIVVVLVALFIIGGLIISILPQIIEGVMIIGIIAAVILFGVAFFALASFAFGGR
jgi:hypothetical protein